MTTRSRTHTRKTRSLAKPAAAADQARGLREPAAMHEESQQYRHNTLSRAKEELRKLFRRPTRPAANPHRAQHQERRHS
jgi:hypothetical protein